jgi:hypothetical protein
VELERERERERERESLDKLGIKESFSPRQILNYFESYTPPKN